MNYQQTQVLRYLVAYCMNYITKGGMRIRRALDLTHVGAAGWAQLFLLATIVVVLAASRRSSENRRVA